MLHKILGIIKKKNYYQDKVPGEDAILIEDSVTESLPDENVSGGGIPLVKNLNGKRLLMEWKNIINSLPKSLGDCRSVLDELSSRLFIDNNRIEIYVGDLDDSSNNKLQSCQGYLQNRLRKVFGDALLLVFKQELDFTNLSISEKLPLNDIEFGPGESNEEMILRAEVMEYNSVIDALENEIVLLKYPQKANAIIKIVNYYGEVARKLEKIEEISREDFAAPIKNLYQKIITHSQKLFIYPKWRDEIKRTLFGNIPILYIVQYLFVESQLFSVPALRRPIFKTDVSISMLVKYIESRNSPFFSQRDVIVICIELANIEPAEWVDNLKLALGVRSLKNNSCIIITEKLSREGVAKAWDLIRLLDTILDCRPTIFLDNEVVANLILKNDSSRKLQDELDAILYKRLNSSMSTLDVNHVVKGSDFYGRTDELLDYVRLIDQGKNFHISGLRRSGKTSTIYQLRDFVANEYVVGVCDARHYKDGAELMPKLLAELLNDGGRKFPELDWEAFENTEILKNDFENEVIRLANFLPRSAKIVIIIDEIEHVISKEKNQFVANWQAFLGALHKLSVVGEFQERIVLITIGKFPILTRSMLYDGQSPFFLDEAMKYPMMSESDCRDMISDLGLINQIDFTNTEVLERILGLTGGHAKLTRALCEQIANDNYGKRPLSVTINMVDNATTNLLLPGSKIHRVFFDIYNEIDAEEKSMIDRIIQNGPNTQVSKIKTLTNSHFDEELINSLNELGLVAFGKNEYGVFVNVKMQLLVEYRRSLTGN